MKIRCLILALCFTANALQAQSEPSVDELVSQLQAAVKKALAAQAAKAPADKSDRTAEMAYARNQEYLMYLGRLNLMVKQARDSGQVDDVLSNLQALTTDDEVEKIASQLSAKIKAELQAQRQATADALSAKITAAVQTALGAKEAKEIDASIMELSKAAQRGNSCNEDGERLQERARNAAVFLCRWQDYLVRLQRNDEVAAQQILRIISEDRATDSFLPRSEILSRMTVNGEKPVGKKNDNLDLPSIEGKSIPEIRAMKSTVRNLVAANGMSQPLRELLDRITDLDRACTQAEQGLYGQVFAYCTNQNGNNNDDAFAAPRQEILLHILPAYLGLDKGYEAQPKENAADYLQRLAREARAKGDWVTYWKALETYRAVAFRQGNQPAWLTGQISGASLFVTAQNLEKAGQFTEAIRSYRRIAASPGQDLPIQEAAARVEAIRKDHPDDYEAALKPVTPITVTPQQPGRYPMPASALPQQP